MRMRERERRENRSWRLERKKRENRSWRRARERRPAKSWEPCRMSQMKLMLRSLLLREQCRQSRSQSLPYCKSAGDRRLRQPRCCSSQAQRAQHSLRRRSWTVRNLRRATSSSRTRTVRCSSRRMRRVVTDSSKRTKKTGMSSLVLRPTKVLEEMSLVLRSLNWVASQMGYLIPKPFAA